jgi:mannose-1-phosphate guanylyltransferase
MGGGSRVFSSDITIHDTSINNSSKKEKHNNNNNNKQKQKQKQKPSCCVAKERSSIEVLGMKDNIVVVKQTNKTSNSSSSSNH